MINFIAGIIIVGNYVCIPLGPTFSDGDLKTYTEVSCLMTPLSNNAVQCLSKEFISLEDIDL